MEHRMKIRTFAIMALVMMGTPASLFAQDKTSWDDLSLVKSSRFQRVYLLPGANFSQYNKVMFDKTEVAFVKDWLKDYNRYAGTLSRRISSDRANEVLQEVSTTFGDVFEKAFQDGGFQVVQSPGPDVVRIRTGVVDLSVSAPDIKEASRSFSGSWEAGQATLFLEARDSQTGALLGRALDRQLAGDSRAMMRNSVTNRSDFKVLFKRWAKESVEGFQQLKSTPGIQTVRN
jgi:hypothetical protein